MLIAVHGCGTNRRCQADESTADEMPMMEPMTVGSQSCCSTTTWSAIWPMRRIARPQPAVPRVVRKLQVSKVEEESAPPNRRCCRGKSADAPARLCFGHQRACWTDEAVSPYEVALDVATKRRHAALKVAHLAPAGGCKADVHTSTYMCHGASNVDVLSMQGQWHGSAHFVTRACSLRLNIHVHLEAGEGYAMVNECWPWPHAGELNLIE